MDNLQQNEVPSASRPLSRRRALYVPPAIVAVALAKPQKFHGSGPVNSRGGNGRGLKKGLSKEKTNNKQKNKKS